MQSDRYICTHRHRDRRYTHRHVTLTVWFGGLQTPPVWRPVSSYLRSTSVLRLAAHGLVERATRLPHLDWPCLSRSSLGGAAQLVSQVLGGRSLWDERQAPPLIPPRPWPCHWPQRSGAWPGWGWGCLRWPPARLSACLPGLRARRRGWLGCTWVPSQAPAPAMGNSHHKRKAPSGPRARSFWRFGRSAKRPAGRGRVGAGGGGGGGAGGEEGLPAAASATAAAPSRGLAGVSFGGRVFPA